MAALPGEKTGSAECAASLETGQGRKEADAAKQQLLTGVQSTTSALSFLPGAKSTISTGLGFHLHLVPSQMNRDLCSMAAIKVSSARLILWMRPKPDSDFSSEKSVQN